MNGASQTGNKIRRFKTYSAYKDSSVGWLGMVPEGWPIKRLRFVADINPVKSEVRHIASDTLVSFVSMDAVGEDGNLRLDTVKSIDEVATGYTYFRDGDVVVAKITPCFENGKGAIAEGLENGIGFGTTELHVLRSRAQLDRHYLFYLTISHTFRSLGAACMYGAGGQKRVPDDFIRDFRQPIPALAEQLSIIAFLDRETERIDRLIAKKELQIELLLEKRSALISHVVTKGLNPKAKMKDSEIEWLGEIPAHWEVKKLKYLADGSLVNGLFKKKENFGTGYKLVNVFDIYRDNFLVDYNSLDRVEADEDEVKKYGVQPGDIFFVRSSLKLEGVGRSVCALEVAEPTVFECHVVRARPRQELITPKYLVNFLNSVHATRRFIALANMVTMATIDQDKIKSLEIPLPPLADQNKITEYLDNQTVIIDNVAKKIRESIDKLQEYRASLISAAVTGKIDVREEVA